MALWRGLLAAGFCFALMLRAAAPNIEFSGVLVADGKTRIALTDKASSTTQWLEPGSEFNGYVVDRFDPKDDAVFLKKGGDEFRLGLVAAKTPDNARSPAAPAGTGGAATTAATSAVRANLRTLAAAARQYQLERGPGPVTYADLVGPGKSITELKPVAGENYTGISFAPNTATVSVAMADGSTVAVDLGSNASGLAAQPTRAATAATASTAQPVSAVPLPSTPSPAAAVVSNAQPPPVAGTLPATAAPGATEPAMAPTGRDNPPITPHYFVQTGDTWEKISATTGISIDDLRRMNPGVTGSSLPTGQSIRIR
jgi:LysM repeat protein